MENHTIFGVHITDRVVRAKDVQAVFTEFGCHIKTRLGLHHVDGGGCSPNGLILLEVTGAAAEIASFESKLRAVDGVQLQKMVFTH
jgi:hypothetical protein